MATITKIIPLLNRVLIQKISAPKQSAGGILLTTGSETDLDMGKVISTGPGVQNSLGTHRACLVSAGQTVLLPSYGGQVFDFDNEKYFIYKDTELVGIVN